MTKAKRNKDFAIAKLSKMITTHPDWVTVVLFYSALHFVDAHLLMHHGIRRIHHEEREQAVAQHMGDIYASYKRLFDLGFRARYHSISDNPTKDEAESALQYDFPDVENYVNDRLR